MKGYIDKIKQFDLKSVDKRQKIAAAAGVSGLFILAGILVFATDSGANSKDTESPVKIEESQKKIQVSKLAGGVSAQNKWMQQAESELKGLEEKVDKQSTENSQLQNKLDETQSGTSEKMQKLEEEVQEYKQKLENFISSSGEMFMGGHEGEGSAPTTKSIKTIEIALDGNSSFSQRGLWHKLDYYLPANSYAKAILIESVDASVGVTAQGDPRPVLLRVISQAKSAVNDDDIQKVDIVGCTLSGAASGDLSSERAYIKLLKMTCSRENNTAFEAEVQGHVSSQGKAGIRGEVISREGDFIAKSFMAGMVSGLGNGLNQANSPPPSLFSLGTNTQGMKDIAGQGIGKGVQSSAERLSSYLIQRAEQYQPVISVPAGIEVNVIFHDGVYIDGRKGALHNIEQTG